MQLLQVHLCNISSTSLRHFNNKTIRLVCKQTEYIFYFVYTYVGICILNNFSEYDGVRIDSLTLVGLTANNFDKTVRNCFAYSLEFQEHISINVNKQSLYNDTFYKNTFNYTHICHPKSWQNITRNIAIIPIFLFLFLVTYAIPSSITELN